MRVLVCGSRHFTDYRLLKEVLDEINASSQITEIIEGGAKGADRLSVEWGVQNNVRTNEFPADWDVHGKAAGPIRNAQMLREGKPDMVVAFLAKDSRGTKNMIEQACEAWLPMRIVYVS